MVLGRLSGIRNLVSSYRNVFRAPPVGKWEARRTMWRAGRAPPGRVDCMPRPASGCGRTTQCGSIGGATYSEFIFWWGSLSPRPVKPGAPALGTTQCTVLFYSPVLMKSQRLFDFSVLLWRCSEDGVHNVDAFNDHRVIEFSFCSQLTVVVFSTQ